MDEKLVSITMEQKGNFEFLVKFDQGVELVMDEPEPVGGYSGPRAAEVLSAAIGHCLTASFLFCLQKARVEVKGIKTTVKSTIKRNEKGRLRVDESYAKIYMNFGGEPPERMKRCLEIFEDFCMVTSSVRKGFPVTVEIEDQRGQQLFLSKQ